MSLYGVQVDRRQMVDRSGVAEEWPVRARAVAHHRFEDLTRSARLRKVWMADAPSESVLGSPHIALEVLTFPQL